MVEPIFNESDFEVIAGSSTIYSLMSSGSGKQVNVQFCAQCGTKICLTFERFPSVVGVYAGTFDDPSWFDRSPETTACLFLEGAQAGALVPACVRTYREHRTAIDGSPTEPVVFDTPFEVRRGD